MQIQVSGESILGEPVYISLTTIIVLLVVALAISLVKYASLRATLSSCRKEVERLNAQARFQQNNAQHSEVLLKAYKDSNNLSVAFFTEEIVDKSYFSTQIRMAYKSQIYLNGIPVGQPSTLKEDVTKSVDRDAVNQALNDFALPLIKAGIEVVGLLNGSPTKVIQNARPAVSLK